MNGMVRVGYYDSRRPDPEQYSGVQVRVELDKNPEPPTNQIPVIARSTSDLPRITGTSHLSGGRSSTMHTLASESGQRPLTFTTSAKKANHTSSIMALLRPTVDIFVCRFFVVKTRTPYIFHPRYLLCEAIMLYRI